MSTKPTVARDDSTASPVQGESSSRQVVRGVIQGLYEGRYVPGQRMVEPDLMAAFGVSRSTVREALKELSSDGIVELAAFRGAQIRRLSRAQAANLFAVTEVILGLAARQAAQHIGLPGAADKVGEVFATIEKHRENEDAYTFFTHRNRYFRTLVEISGNQEILRMLPRLQVHLIRNRLAVPVSERIEGYRRITLAVLAGEAKKAEAAARGYVGHMATHVLPHFPEKTV